MASFDFVQSLINSAIRENGNNEITGKRLNQVLTTLVNAIVENNVVKEILDNINYAEVDGIATKNVHYVFPDMAGGQEDDVIVTENTLKSVYVPDFTVEDIYKVKETGISLDINYDALMTAVHKQQPIFVKELPDYPGINSCSYFHEDLLYLRITTIHAVITIDIAPDGQIKAHNINVISLFGGDGIVSLSKEGVVSQRQVWTRAADKGYDYTIADIVRGGIPQANIDLLRANGIIFNEDSGYFECGPLRDLSYNDAINILAKTNAFAQGASAVSGVGLGCVIDENESEKFRTNVPLLPYRWYMYSGGSFGYLCWNNRYIEILNLKNRNGYVEIANDMNSAFGSCYRLKKIENIIEVNRVASFAEAFKNCYSLESVNLRHIKKNISFSDSARLDYASIKFMIENSQATTAIAFTLHATALANAEAAYLADAGQDLATYPTLSDWALSKNIQIATA